MRLCAWIRWLSLSAATFLVLPAHAGRLALVIGNDSYTHVASLSNARNDAQLIGKTLKGAGFEIVGGVRTNLDRKSMWEAVDQFEQRIYKGDDVVFYYAGHGVQIGTNPMLLPVDINAESDAQVVRDGVNLSEVQDKLKAARFALLVIDACRNNPFPPKPGHTRGIGEGRGLQPVEPAEGSAILMSASRGQTALDNVPGVTAANSLFTYELTQAISTPGLDVVTALRQVRDSVEDQAKRANHNQRPALVEEMRGQFILFPGPAAAPVPPVQAAEGTGLGKRAAPGPAPPTAMATHIPTPTELDEQTWQATKNSKDAIDFSSYIKNFPKGLHLAEADLLMRRLTRQPKPQGAPASTLPAPSGSPRVATTANAKPGSLVANNSAVPQSSTLDKLAQQELRDYGVEARPQVHDRPLDGPTPANIPGGQLITTRGLVALMREEREAFLLLDAFGGNKTLPGARLVREASNPGWVGDDNEQEFGEWLRHATRGNRNMTLVFFCASSTCWRSYNAAIRAIHLGYRNVYWYRGGLEAWTLAGLETVSPPSN